jgi:DNA-binding winged helix-turn-helix (wHTH) protein
VQAFITGPQFVVAAWKVVLAYGTTPFQADGFRLKLRVPYAKKSRHRTERSPGKTPRFLRDCSVSRETTKMQTEQILRFGPYRFDPRTMQLWRGTLEVSLTPKALAVLHVLAMRPGEVVTKEEFFASVWGETVVSDDALAVCIQELRRALREDARNPRYIETVHRRGYRFIGKVVSAQFSVVRQDKRVSSQRSVSSRQHQHSAPTLHQHRYRCPPNLPSPSCPSPT